MRTRDLGLNDLSNASRVLAILNFGSSMVVVGLTGGIASGKSFVAQCLEELGAHRIDADQVAHEVLQDKKVISKIVDQWGEKILCVNGQIDRKQLAEVVFGGVDDKNLDKLESIVHPEVRNRFRLEMESLQDSAEVDFLVLDIPLLFEGKYDQHCNYVIFVDASLSVRQQRAQLRGWADDELARRESRQLPIEEKKLQSDLVIDNSGSKESTARQLADFCHRLKRKIPQSFRDLYLNLSTDKEFKTNPPDDIRKIQS